MNGSFIPGGVDFIWIQKIIVSSTEIIYWGFLLFYFDYFKPQSPNQHSNSGIQNSVFDIHFLNFEH